MMRVMGKLKHGMCGTTEHRIWTSMKTRCLNPNSKSYSDYGGRGITVCDKWLDFVGFFEDMGYRPSSEHTLDRTDNDEGYCKGNCKWSTYEEQGRNKRDYANNTSGVKGVKWHSRDKKWYVRLGAKHIGYSHYFEEACKMRLDAENKYWGNKKG